MAATILMPMVMMMMMMVMVMGDGDDDEAAEGTIGTKHVMQPMMWGNVSHCVVCSCFKDKYK